MPLLVLSIVYVIFSALVIYWQYRWTCFRRSLLERFQRMDQLAQSFRETSEHLKEVVREKRNGSSWKKEGF